jgi:NADH-quinone oxidoreductase subunit C
MDETERLIEDLRGLPAEAERVDYRQRGYHLEVGLQAGQVRSFAELLREKEFYLTFVSAVHVCPAIEIVYQFACYARPCRIVARSAVANGGTLPSIADIFDGANWHERETRDMFGVVFSDHPNLEPLLLPEEAADLKPLLKKERAIKPADQLRPSLDAQAKPSKSSTDEEAQKPTGEDHQ